MCPLVQDAFCPTCQTRPTCPTTHCLAATCHLHERPLPPLPSALVSRELMPKKSAKAKVVFLFDVDNTLLNNDAVTGDIHDYLEREVGSQKNKSYWQIFERLRSSLGYADYLGALQTYRRDYPHDLHLLQLSRFLINYPFANRLYPGSLDAILHVIKIGPVTLRADAAVLFQ